VLSLRKRSEILYNLLEERLETVLPLAMREAQIDMWLIICQEDDYDPVFPTLVPMDTWAPILQMLVFHDRGPDQGVERVNISMTNTPGLYERPWQGHNPEEQWQQLTDLVQDRDPTRIGVNIGDTQWAAGGLTHNLYTQLVQALPSAYVNRLVSAEALVTRWLATLTNRQISLYEHVANLAHALLAKCYSRQTIVPGVTTSKDLEWRYWQRIAELGLEPSFKPFFNVVRSPDRRQEFGPEDRVIRPGDLVHSDVGIRYLGLCSDHQQWAYILRPGEKDAPAEYKRVLSEANRLQDIFMSCFQKGLTGNQLLQRILDRARRTKISNPRVYSHSLGHFLHEPGPLIGLPWEQTYCKGRGEVTLEDNYAFTMELSVGLPLASWDHETLSFSIEEDVVYTQGECRPLDGRQTRFYLI
jgi:Xaa-Pro aminopeptidase